jgi:hypothetical protein
MNATSRAILQTVLSTDSSLSPVERNAFRDLVEGRVETKVEVGEFNGEHLLITQKKVASLLAVSRITIWRMTKGAILHPVEVIPGMWRYHFREIALLARQGSAPPNESRPRPKPSRRPRNPNRANKRPPARVAFFMC